jgi:signal transduction histidine kinase
VLRFNSIIARILWLHLIVVGGASILMPLLLYFLLVAETNSLHRQAMSEQADRLAHHLAESAGGWKLDLPEGLQDLYSEAYGRYAFAVIDDKGRVVFSSRSDQAAIFSHDQHLSTAAFLETRRGSALISGVSIPATASGATAWIQVAEDMSHRDVLTDDVVANFFTGVAWITLPILLVVILIDAEIVRRSFRPVLLASRQASEIGPRRTDVRLPVTSIPSEIRPLVEAVNQALDRLEHGFNIQREFSADAAHELRTPLTILRARIDTLADRSVSELLRQDVESMSRTVGQLLETAELETIIVNPAAKTDLRAVCAEVVGFIAPLALDQGKDIALSGTEHPVWIGGDAEMIARAIRNLVENAIKHSPADCSVEVALEGDGTIHVRDQGPGISDSDREHLFRRFWRRDRTRSGSAGLGLAIVRQIVEAHNGTIGVENRSTGGAQFSVNFGRPDGTA